MTLLAMPPTTDPVDDLHACLGTLAQVDFDEYGEQRQSHALSAMTQAESQLAAIKLSLLASAERKRHAASVGLANTGQWAARAVNADPVVLQRQVRLSQRLEARTTTQRALASGQLSTEHAAVIVRADEQLPRSVTAAQRAVIEASLVEKAKSMPPTLLRRAARRALAEIETDTRVVDAHENELVVSEEESARARTRLTLHDNSDGTVTGHFTVPTLHGHLLRKILETITAPRRGRLGASQAQVGENVGLRTDWDKARGNAFCELIEHLPTDHLHPRTAATMVVTISEETLRGALAVAHLDTDAELSAGEARRLACGAGILPAVLGGQSLPLDLGRSSRLFTETQRTALGIVHRTCAVDGCDRPFAWCELHHLDSWSSNGATDLANAIPICHFHHQRIHDAHYEPRVGPEGVTFHRRT